MHNVDLDDLVLEVEEVVPLVEVQVAGVREDENMTRTDCFLQNRK